MRFIRDCLSPQDTPPVDLSISAHDRQVLRRLAARQAELAALPIQDEKRELWYRHNALEATRPLIFCRPENAWNEIITPDQLECQGELAIQWEIRLREEVFWGDQLQDDRVIEPYFDVSHVYTETDWGMHETRIGGEDGGSYVWEAPLKDYADMDKLHFPQITLYPEKTARLVELASETLGDILTVRQGSRRWWISTGLTTMLVFLRGLEQAMYDMVDRPAEVHRLMAFLRDGRVARLDFLQMNLLSLNNGGTYVGSGGFGWSRELPQPDFVAQMEGSRPSSEPRGHVRTRDLWGFSDSQETVGVSPRMYGEFVFPYERELLAHFGLNCYGCCEPLDKRWHVVQGLPNLRRVSVSAWASVADMAEKLGNRYIFSMKPSPTDLTRPTFDEEAIRVDLRKALEITRDCRVEVIMKDTHTIQHQPQRLIRWVQIAREEAERL